MSTGRVLVIDDEKSLRLTFAEFLAGDGFQVETAASYDQARQRLEQGRYDVVISDILLGDHSGIDLLRVLHETDPACPVIMVTGYPNLDSAAEAVRLGAFDYLSKPVTKDELLRVAVAARKHRDLHDQVIRYQANLEALFRSIKEAIITVDPDGIITAVNEAAATLCRLPEAAVGQPFATEVSDSGGQLALLLGRTLETRRSTELARHECRFGDAPPVVLSVTCDPLVHPSGSFLGAVLVLDDETRLDHLERNFQERRRLHGMIGKSRQMQEIYGLIEDLANVPTTVLVLGESGTGKELVAEAIHHLGERHGGPLVKVNCAAMSETLLESELFGHTRGAFTGAVRDRIGRFQQADGGTIFLDEIGDISPQMQLRLLRVLQEKEIERLGESKPIPVDVRVLAATNRNLQEKVRKGEFREDLYYRLKVVTLPLPPLRERREDLPLLVEHFRKLLNTDLKKDIRGLSREVLHRFLDYSWPGNVRELRHVMEHAFIRCHEPVVLREHLPPDFFPEAETLVKTHAPLAEEEERQLLLDALRSCGWNKAKTARKLGLDRKTVYRKMERFGIEEEE